MISIVLELSKEKWFTKVVHFVSEIVDKMHVI